MHPTLPAANPFAMLIDPEAVLSAVHGSERLNRIAGRICRPLDRQVTPADSVPRTDDVELLGAGVSEAEFAGTR